MRFDIVRDPARIARIQKRLADREQQLMISRGALVRYETPALPNPFPRLSRILDPESSPHRAQFLGIHYHIETKDRKIEQLLPAAEYYAFVFRAVADRRWIQQYYNEVREPTLRTEQPSFRMVDKVYALKSELSNILLLVRGTLDTIATLMHFLYGPGSSHFTNFAAFVNSLNKRRAPGADVTHYGSIDISFYEPREGVVRTYLQDALQVHEAVAPVLPGLDSFYEFLDGHFARRMTGST